MTNAKTGQKDDSTMLPFSRNMQNQHSSSFDFQNSFLSFSAPYWRNELDSGLLAYSQIGLVFLFKDCFGEIENAF